MSASEIRGYLDLAVESIGDAQASIARGSFRLATSRSYYAMFYCASALLLSRGMAFSRHGAVIAAFGREFAKAGLLDRKFHQYVREAFDTRQVSDYDPIRNISQTTAQIAVQRAVEFLDATRQYLAGTHHGPGAGDS